MTPIAQAHEHVVYGANPTKKAQDIASAEGASEENFGDISVKSDAKFS